MSLGLLAAGPLQMLFSLLLMQGLSLTMWRSFLNQAIPRLEPMKFNMNLGNDGNKPQAPASNSELQNLLPYLNLLTPLLMQQNLQRTQLMQPNLMQQMPQQMQPMSQPMQPMLTNNGQQSGQLQMLPVQTYQMPQLGQQQILAAPAYQMGQVVQPQMVQSQPYQVQQQIQPNQPQVMSAPVYPTQNQPMPHVIIVPQVIPQSQTVQSKGSASTHFPVQVQPPNREPNAYGTGGRISKRMLERPPTTTREPKVDSRLHAGAIHYSFVTPRTPVGTRRYIIPPVTANIIYETDSTEPSVDFRDYTHFYASTEWPQTITESDSVNTYTEITTLSMNENIIESNNEFNSDAIYGTTTIPTTSTNTSDTSDITTSVNNTFVLNTNTTNRTGIMDKNILDKESNVTTIKPNISDSLYSLSDLVHQDFIEHVKTVSKMNPIESNQSPETYFDNPKAEPDYRKFKRVCFYLLNAKDGNLKISDIDPYICSHLIIGFASVALNDLIVPRNPSEDPEKYHKLANLKSINRRLKVMLSVGDGSGGAFSKMVSNNKSRDNFVASVLDLCDAFNFDGIDIDWEFPYYRTGYREDKQNFVSLLKELRIEAINRFRDNFIISATVGTPYVIAMSSYDIPLIGDAVDFVNLMSYDFNIYRSDRPYTGHHSPLYPRPTQKGYFLTLNAAWSATYWANYGMPLHKIVLGIPTYARTYNLVTPISQGLDVPATGPGLGGGKMNYTSVCYFLSSGATKEFDVYSQVPFAYKNFDWIAYESEISAALKAQWVVKAGMGGVMTYALNYDDINGECRRDGKKFPLQKAISNLLELASIRAYRQINHSPDITHYINRV